MAIRYLSRSAHVDEHVIDVHRDAGARTLHVRDADRDGGGIRRGLGPVAGDDVLVDDRPPLTGLEADRLQTDLEREVANARKRGKRRPTATAKAALSLELRLSDGLPIDLP